MNQCSKSWLETHSSLNIPFSRLINITQKFWHKSWFKMALAYYMEEKFRVENSKTVLSIVEFKFQVLPTVSLLWISNLPPNEFGVFIPHNSLPLTDSFLKDTDTPWVPKASIPKYSLSLLTQTQTHTRAHACAHTHSHILWIIRHPSLTTPNQYTTWLTYAQLYCTV